MSLSRYSALCYRDATSMKLGGAAGACFPIIHQCQIRLDQFFFEDHRQTYSLPLSQFETRSKEKIKCVAPKVFLGKSHISLKSFGRVSPLPLSRLRAGIRVSRKLSKLGNIWATSSLFLLEMARLWLVNCGCGNYHFRSSEARRGLASLT